MILLLLQHTVAGLCISLAVVLAVTAGAEVVWFRGSRREALLLTLTSAMLFAVGFLALGA